VVSGPRILALDDRRATVTRMVGRWLSTVAGAAVLGGAMIMLIALVAMPGPWLTGYVSEAGVAGQPLAYAYRIGLMVLALGVALLGRAFGGLPAVLLGVAAVLAGTSGTVPCSPRCPLPPHEPTTVGDVVHASASILGMAVLAGATLAVAMSRPSPPVRVLALAGTALLVPLGGILGLIMLFAGRSEIGADLERVMLVVAVSWLVGTASLLAGGAHPPDDREQRLFDVLDRTLGHEDQPVDGHHQADAEER
jgi:hypothetical protein